MVTHGKRSAGWLAATLIAALLAPATATSARAQAPVDHEAVFAQQLRPLFTRHCGTCHSTAEAKGDLDLERFDSFAAVRREPDVWRDVVDQVANGEMPPAKAPQPGAAEREQMLAGVRALLAELARAQAGDPGPVVLRRLDNAAFTYAVRDLTGVATLDPAREFPVDGAAGEGFTNVGNALGMSPTLAAKYLAAAKSVAEHALLLPDGLRFGEAATRRDQTAERLAAIRAFYRRHTDPRGANVVVVQGLSFQGDVGGRLPAAKYFDATLALRDGAHDAPARRALAAAGGLSPKYLDRLWRELTDGAPSLLLDDLRARWRTAPAGSGEALAAAIAPWQQRLFAFRTVGHIGKLGGPKAWLEPVDAVVEQQDVRLPLPAAAADGAATVQLVVRSAGEGAATVRLREPRLVRAGHPDLPLRDLRGLGAALAARRTAIAASAASCLAAVAAMQGGRLATADAAAAFGVEPALLQGWLELLGVDASGAASAIDAQQLLAKPVRDSNGHRAVQGWTAGELPTVLANASDEALRVPGTMAPRRVAVHPTPQQRVVAAWRAPRSERARIAVRVQRAHMACGNGVAWELSVRRGGLALRLADGIAADAHEATATVADVALAAGDFVALAIGARAGDHTCDLTTIDLAITAADGTVHDLAADVAPDILAGNPHPDRHGRADAWRFAAEADAGEGAGIPAGSALGAFVLAADDAQRAAAAQRVQQLLAGQAPERDDDRALLARLQAVDGPLYRDCRADAGQAAADDGFGCAPDAFDGRDLLLRSDAALALRVPAAFAAGATLVATATVASTSAADGAQLQARSEPSAGPSTGLLDAPLLARSPAARQRLVAACDAFRDLLPPALCYAQIVPVDEAVTLTQYHREDDALRRLLLDDAEAAQLDRLWRELHFVAQDALTAVDAYEQIWQYATQDADPKAFEPLRAPIHARADAFRAELRAAEPRHLDAVLAFADRAWRRPLTDDDGAQLRALYQQLRQEGLAHDDAIRLLLARVLASPNFLYRAEAAPAGAAAAPVSALELATRLSFCLTASPPDAELRAAAADGSLLRPEVLTAQGRRLLAGPGAERLAREFGLSWLHLRDFASEAEKSERLFPEFPALRGAMHEEVVRFLTDWLQRDGALDELLAADHAFVDDALAAHYGLPPAGSGGAGAGGWRRVDGMRALGRGGLLGTAAVLASQSGASRTSPILRGNWIAEALLGDKLPRPPKSVPKLPDDETSDALTMRELTERHRRDPDCARCHDRIDHFGLALEAFDAIGRRRTQDLGGRPIDARVEAPDGAVFTDLDGLRAYLLTTRRAAFERQFLRKLLGYALGRGVLLSDQPLLDAIHVDWPQHGHRIGFAIERILLSPQFRCARGRDWSER